MKTLTNDYQLKLDDYVFKNSPESCSDNSSITENTDWFSSDEDFLQQLSSDLDIPLLLNPGEDELSVLNSFFDKTPAEILSEIELPRTQFNDVFKTEPPSPPPTSPHVFVPNSDVTKVKIEPHSPPRAAKRPLQPKSFVPHNSVMFLDDNKFTPSKVVVLENSAKLPINLNPVLVGNGLNLNAIDAKMLKRQQRKIKNRESACLSRKKRKDYLTSLENQVKELSKENEVLRMQNSELKGRLSKYETKPVTSSSKSMKNSVALCVFVFVVVVNMDFIRNPFTVRNDMTDLTENLPIIDHHSGRNLLWAEGNPFEKSDLNNSLLTFSMCPATINQTENSRLVLELEKWIGKPKLSNTFDNITNLPKIKLIKKRKLLKKRLDIRSLVSPTTKSLYSMQNIENSEIQVFSPNSEFSEFFGAINKQDDTYYVVSLSDHHMLLPALHHNKTRRPKMSLIMPSMFPTNNGNFSHSNLVPLMQIDCEVLNTKLIQIRYGLIPQHLRNNNNASQQNRNENGNENKNNNGKNGKTYASEKKIYKPYFVNDNLKLGP